MRDGASLTRFRQGISQDLQRMGDWLGSGRARLQDWWRLLSLPSKLCFVVVGLGFLIILARLAFSWDALSCAGNCSAGAWRQSNAPTSRTRDSSHPDGNWAAQSEPSRRSTSEFKRNVPPQGRIYTGQFVLGGLLRSRSDTSGPQRGLPGGGRP